MALRIVEDDLNGAEVQALLAYHLRGMHAASAPGNVFALDLSGLRGPGVTVFATRDEGRLAGVGAL